MNQKPDRWFAFECFQCIQPNTSGLVFDVRLDASEFLNRARCPRCGAECELRASWNADENGYGSRAGIGIPLQLIKDRLLMIEIFAKAIQKRRSENEEILKTWALTGVPGQTYRENLETIAKYEGKIAGWQFAIAEIFYDQKKVKS